MLALCGSGGGGCVGDPTRLAVIEPPSGGGWSPRLLPSGCDPRFLDICGAAAARPRWSRSRRASAQQNAAVCALAAPSDCRAPPDTQRVSFPAAASACAAPNPGHIFAALDDPAYSNSAAPDHLVKWSAHTSPASGCPCFPINSMTSQLSAGRAPRPAGAHQCRVRRGARVVVAAGRERSAVVRASLRFACVPEHA